MPNVLLAHIPIPPKLLVPLILLGVGLLVWGIATLAGAGKKKKPAHTGGPHCSTCGTAGRWIFESNGWGCDRCRTMIQTPHVGTHPVAPPAAPPQA